MITADLAAEVAAEQGLSLADAQALSVLADDREHAVTLAARFGRSAGKNAGKLEAERRFGPKADR